MISVGDRVLFVAPWSSFHGHRGEVIQVLPYVMVLLDGDRHPIRCGLTELVPEHGLPTEPNLTGAE